VSADAAGNIANGISLLPAISNNGKRVAILSSVGLVRILLC